mgnify:CR=1 FL=1
MKGSYEISVQNNKVKYQFTIRRNITVIQGNSATGKTTLVDLIREYQMNPIDSGISLSSKKKCSVLEGADWNKQLLLITDSIVFIDEGNAFIASKEFASAIKNTDNYYVLITREGLENLPYSVDEIYGIHTSGKYSNLKQVHHEFFHIYNFTESFDKTTFERIITEDSNSGFDFFNTISKNKYICESASGKSNIFKMIENSPLKTLIIADGAAFGSQIDKILKLTSYKKDCFLFLPESFEYILLQSELIKDSEITKILDSPENFIDSTKYFSWEQFFTKLLIEKAKDSFLQYKKKNLNKGYLSENIIQKILNSEVFAKLKEFFN